MFGVFLSYSRACETWQNTGSFSGPPMFSRNLLRSSSVWFHFGKRVLGSVGSFAIRMEIRQFISEGFPLDNAYHGEMIGDDTKRTDEDAVKSETLPSRSSS